MKVNKAIQDFNSVTEDIRKVTDVAQRNPMEAAPMVKPLMEKFENLKQYEGIKASSLNKAEIQPFHDAIESFLKSTKEAQEKVGALGSAIFGSSLFKEVTGNFEQVKKSLERGERVEPTEHEGL